MPSKPFVEDYFSGIVRFDLTKTYWSLQSLQWCWSHPKHDLQAVIDMGARFGRWIGSRLGLLTSELYHHCAEYRVRTILHKVLLPPSGHLCGRIKSLLMSVTGGPEAAVRGVWRGSFT